MKLLIDIQGFQSTSRHRGIGRYSLALTDAILKNRGRHKVMLLANGAFTNELQSLRQHFIDSVPDDDFIIFDSELPVSENQSSNIMNCRLSELHRERLIYSISPDAVLVTSLFEGFLDNAVTSIGRIGMKPFTSVILYDLIPFLSPDLNWPIDYKLHYNGKIESLLNADLLLSISNYTRKEASEAIPDLTNRIKNISSACSSKFYPEEVPNERQVYLRNRYGIHGPFLMSSGYIEPRKNFHLIVSAFSNLPIDIKNKLQIVIVGDSTDITAINHLRNIAFSNGIDDNQLIITGYVPDSDLIDLYRLCEVFIFPSKYEGFGLPPLEAMSCGAVTIGARATSIPEVIGLHEALFDPNSSSELQNLLVKVLTNKDFASYLRTSGLERSRHFSWEQTAKTTLNAIDDSLSNTSSRSRSFHFPKKQKTYRLAVVTPFPPEETGIATYFSDLLPSINKYYDVTVINDRLYENNSSNSLNAKPVSWFESNYDAFDRIIYQVGNSPFHAHMLSLLCRYPGIVILHDFFLSSLYAWMECTGYQPSVFKESLYYSHGFQALDDLLNNGEKTAKNNWPCNFEVLQNSIGIIVHSNHSKELVYKYYGKSFNSKIFVTHLNRSIPKKIDKKSAKNFLGINIDCFLVCAFGFMDPTKMNHLLLKAWGSASLSKNKMCRLVFVGGNAPEEYNQEIKKMIMKIEDGERIHITGYTTKEEFDLYLSAADIAVQLRSSSRGETSGTVLDCLSHGIPVIINNHGSLAEYPDNVVAKISENFHPDELSTVLEKLYFNIPLRTHMSKNGVDYVSKKHSPDKVAYSYFNFIEKIYSCEANQYIQSSTHLFWKRTLKHLRLVDLPKVSRKISSIMSFVHRSVIYIDISATARNDLKTGIERVARSILREMLLNPPIGYQIRPVYLSKDDNYWRVRYANQYLNSHRSSNIPPNEDDNVIPKSGDILFSVDLFPDGVCSAEKQGLYRYWKAAGARIGFIVFDILPVTHPAYFPEWLKPMIESWLKSVAVSSDFLICISKHVKKEIKKWLGRESFPTNTLPEIKYCHLGADFYSSTSIREEKQKSADHLPSIIQHPTFLMVGTIEPRKGHLLILRSFSKLWAKGFDINLIIVGHEGWKPLKENERGNIPEIIHYIRSSPENGKHLFWFEGISDQDLQDIYNNSIALIAASEDEGFGLPLIEAAQKGLPIIARDIPVFHEVAGENAFYFHGTTPDSFSEELVTWLDLYKKRRHPQSVNMKWLTWKESVQEFLNIVIPK